MQKPPAHLLGIDAGGSVLKAAVFTRDGHLLGAHCEPLPVIAPDALRRERDPALMWEATGHSVRGALAAAGLTGDDIAAVGITAYGNGLYLVDETGQPLMNGVLSSDHRAERLIAHWRGDGIAEAHRRAAFQDLWPGKPLPLLANLAQTDPGLLARAHKLLLCKDFLRAQLTGRLATDVTDAAASSLLAGTSRHESQPMFELLGLGAFTHLMPEVLEPGTQAGTVTAAAARRLGLREGTPVAAGLSDNTAMLCGSGASGALDVNIVAGTWALQHAHIAAPRDDGSVLACCHGVAEGSWLAIEASTASASAFEWFINVHATLLQAAPGARSATYAQINEAVEEACARPERGGPPLVFLPHLNAAFDDPAARGAFIGLSAEHTLGDIARALYEGVAFEHRRHLERIRSVVPQPARICFTGGAARSAVWSQIFADALELPLDIPDGEEIGALGAAMAGAVAIGWYGGFDTAIAAMTRVQKRIPPTERGVHTLRRRYLAYNTAREQLRTLWAHPAFQPLVPGAD